MIADAHAAARRPRHATRVATGCCALFDAPSQQQAYIRHVTLPRYLLGSFVDARLRRAAPMSPCHACAMRMALILYVYARRRRHYMAFDADACRVISR